MLLRLHPLAHRCHILKIMNRLLCAGLLDVARSTAAAPGQLHGRNDEGAELVHIDDGHHFLGGGLTTWHLDLEKDKDRHGQAWEHNLIFIVQKLYNNINKMNSIKAETLC